MIDVREGTEILETGSIANAVNIPRGLIEMKLAPTNDDKGLNIGVIKYQSVWYLVEKGLCEVLPVVATGENRVFSRDDFIIEDQQSVLKDRIIHKGLSDQKVFSAGGMNKSRGNS